MVQFPLTFNDVLAGTGRETTRDSGFLLENGVSRARDNHLTWLADLQGKAWHLQDLRGKVVLVNFFLGDMVPALPQGNARSALYNTFKDRGFVVLASSDEEAAQLAPFIRERKISYPVLLDPGRKVNDVFSVEGIPKSLVYDRSGEMVAQSIAMRSRTQFVEMLAQAGLQ